MSLFVLVLSIAAGMVGGLWLVLCGEMLLFQWRHRGMVQCEACGCWFHPAEGDYAPSLYCYCAGCCSEG